MSPNPHAPATPRRIVVFGDDWGRHPSSCQHIMSRLAARYRIDWVNTIGTRRPRPRLCDVVRGFEKLGQYASWRRTRVTATDATGAYGGGIAVHAPLHWPGFRYRWERSLNSWIFSRALSSLLF